MKKIMFFILMGMLTTIHAFGSSVQGSATFICEVPQNLMATNITQSGVELSWTAPSGGDLIQMFQYSITTTPTPENGPTSESTSAVSMITLNPATTYYAYVRSFCSGVWSDWSEPVVFTTLCSLEPLPYFEDFESLDLGGLPRCTGTQSLTPGNSWVVTSNPGSDFSSNTLHYIGNDNPANSWFFTKSFYMEAGVFYKLSFKYGNNSMTTVESLAVTFTTDQDFMTAIGSQPFFTPITEITGGVQQNYVAGPFIAPAAGEYHLAFNVFSDAAQGHLMIDDILIEEWICGTPPSVEISNVSQNSAQLSWEMPAGNPVQVYNYAVTTSATPPVDNIVFAVTLESQLNGLEPNTTYYVHVRAMCSGVPSEWETISFTTEAELGLATTNLTNLLAYPNPTADRLFITNDAIINDVAIYNLLGQIVLESTQSGMSIELDLAQLQNGLYLLKATSDGSSKTISVVKK